MLSRLRILPRLMIGFGALLLLIVGLSGFTIQSDRSTRDLFDRVARLKDNELLAQRVSKRIYEGRMQVWMALSLGDQEHWKSASAAFQVAHDRLQKLIASTTDPTRLAKANQLPGLLTDLEAKEARLKELKSGSNAALDTPEMRQALAEAGASAGQIEAITEPLSAAYDKAAVSADADATDQLDGAISFAVVLGIVSILAGVVLAAFIARSIVKPINAITESMRVLATGNTEAEIPGAGRKDEVGEMAVAVRVFRDGMVETTRLRAEQEATAQCATAERRRGMLDVAAKFEATVGSIVGSVTSQATELHATAQAMAATAEETSRQSITVATASEQASQNVQTVAAAAEELSASVREITEQVARSGHMIADAVAQADQSNEQVVNLSQAAEKVGDVVRIIAGIAAQTNLLALNATIEAARAGEAGKGFAVVASEVKALANQTAKATDEIDMQIRAIRDATQTSARSILGVSQTISKVNETAAIIAAAVEEQGSATQEIARNVQQAAKGTSEVSSTIGGVNQAAQQAGAAASEVLSSAGELGRNSSLLKKQVDEFLLEVRAA